MLVKEQLEPECLQAVGLLNEGRFGEAVQLFTDILRKDPESTLAWNNRGLALLKLGHPFDAIMNIDKAIEYAPTEAAYYNNKGAALFEQLDVSEALSYYDKAILLKNDFPEALNNRGNALKFQGHLPEAAESYRKSIEVKPDYADAHLNLSFTELAQGNYKEGWKEFEWRWRCGQMPPRGLKIPEWDGQVLTDKSILIYGEQGFGDVLQFIRYAKVIKNLYNCKVYVEVRHPLTRLIKTTPGIDQVITLGESIPEGIDYAIPMLSVPRVIGTSLETIPWDGPYFNIDTTYKQDFWKEKLNLLPKGKLVGVCWAGMSRPGRPEAESVDRKRSTTLQTFAPLAQIPGISWVSLQKGPASEQVTNPPSGMTIGDWTSDCDDFYDTASLISNLDLVISVDTAVVHLAAALGKPTWVLSRWDGCWRWLNNQQKSPWYPSARVFGQKQPNDWTGAITEVACELQKIVIDGN